MLKAEFLTRYKEPVRQVDRLRILDGRRSDHVVVMKFGGAALRDAKMIDANSRLIADYYYQGFGVIPVVSAMQGITDWLVGVLDEQDPDKKKELAQEIALFHFRTARELFKRIKNVEGIRGLIRSFLEDVGELDANKPEHRDRILSYGEMFSARLVAAALRRNLQSGSAKHLDAVYILVTDDTFGEANPDDKMSSEKMKNLRYYLDAGNIPVITGFIGATSDGRVTTLGRNGSDFSASYIAHQLNAKGIYFWKDVEGIYDLDPNVFPDQAKVISRLSYDEAEQMSNNGMKAIHPRAIHPARTSGIPIQVRSFLNPKSEGTTIA